MPTSKGFLCTTFLGFSGFLRSETVYRLDTPKNVTNNETAQKQQKKVKNQLEIDQLYQKFLRLDTTKFRE